MWKRGDEMEQMEAVRAWLAGWEGGGLEALTAEQLGKTPACGLFFAGTEVLERKESICGGASVRTRAAFWLLRAAYAPPGSPAAGEMGQWMLDFQRWLRSQSAHDLVPRLGTSRTWAQAESAGILRGKADGETVWRIRVTLEYETEEKES